MQVQLAPTICRTSPCDYNHIIWREVCWFVRGSGHHTILDKALFLISGLFCLTAKLDAFPVALLNGLLVLTGILGAIHSCHFSCYSLGRALTRWSPAKIPSVKYLRKLTFGLAETPFYPSLHRQLLNITKEVVLQLLTITVATTQMLLCLACWGQQRSVNV